MDRQHIIAFCQGVAIVALLAFAYILPLYCIATGAI